MRRLLLAVTATLGLIAFSACTDEPSTSTVPRLSATSTASTGTTGDTGNPNAVGGDASAARRTKLHAAADCVRQHGAPNYQDPLLTSDGYVYTDDVALRSLDGPQLDAIETACQDLIRAASFSMRDQGPAPPKLIQAGVRSAQCLRENGLPNFKDPTADRPFSPGKGFGLDPEAIPAGGKQNPTVMRALQACRKILDEEAALSSLGSLGHA
ncbi:hypothetical protein HH310_02175 [Actinoplanes sp. TBRC 11911]|uniref:hypothetical protein n=1 Tax=Actinoplanes sp. TBRC 11911 TaxID=2729386 RepID=UPI00145ED139|nr:hypothetical protein [Actinoplanes sp. TBRC 11911]NMO50003.1 hypothetical protein [Actinoplanes sp. TBRC 11911]